MHVTSLYSEEFSGYTWSRVSCYQNPQTTHSRMMDTTCLNLAIQTLCLSRSVVYAMYCWLTLYSGCYSDQVCVYLCVWGYLYVCKGGFQTTAVFHPCYATNYLCRRGASASCVWHVDFRVWGLQDWQNNPWSEGYPTHTHTHTRTRTRTLFGPWSLLPSIVCESFKTTWLNTLGSEGEHLTYLLQPCTHFNPPPLPSLPINQIAITPSWAIHESIARFIGHRWINS